MFDSVLNPSYSVGRPGPKIGFGIEFPKPEALWPPGNAACSVCVTVRLTLHFRLVPTTSNSDFSQF